MVEETQDGRLRMDCGGKKRSFDLNLEPECDRDSDTPKSSGSSGGHQDDEMDELVGAIGVDDVMILTFDTEEEVGKFYNLYAKLNGFGFRKSNGK